MKKFLLLMVSILAAMPFVSADEININSEYGANRVTQSGASISVATYTNDRANAVTGINNPTGAVLTLYGRNDVNVRSIAMEPTDIPNPVFPSIKTKGVKIYFDEIPVTGKYILSIAAGALEIGTDTNATFQIPLPGEYGGEMGNDRCINLTAATNNPVPFPAPIINRASGTYDEGTQVGITAGTGGQVAYRFTPAGSTEEEEWRNTGMSNVTITLKESGTLEAKTVGTAGLDSEVVSATYTVTAAPWDVPTFSEQSGAYEAGTKVTVTAPAGAFVAYTFDADGDYTETGANTYTFEINEGISISAYSYGGSKENSEKVSATYTVKTPEPVKFAAPTFNPESGYVFEAEKGEVTITAPAGAVVAYKVGDAAEFTTADSNVVKVELTEAEVSIVAYSSDAAGTDNAVWSEQVTATYKVVGSSVAEIAAEFGGDVEIFTMNGVRVNREVLEPGFYVVVKGGKATKVLVK